MNIISLYPQITPSNSNTVWINTQLISITFKTFYYSEAKFGNFKNFHAKLPKFE